MKNENAIIETKPLITPQRSNKLQYHLTVICWMFFGILPGLASFYVYYLLHTRVHLSPLESTCFVLAAMCVLTFGFLLGVLIGCVQFPDRKNVPAA